ncbi:Co-chaperone protein HscB like protein [Dictyocoela muelleri]|nr:Co-chaperone protein HscB like protein [Dictyocoela muelleri]
MIQKINYFDLFKLKPIFNLDKNILQKNYHELCRTLHPDKKIDNKEKLNSDLLDKKIIPFEIITEGYQTLNNDLKRAEHLMKIQGKKKSCRLSNKFLEKIFDLESKKDDQNVISYCKNKIDKYKNKFMTKNDAENFKNEDKSNVFDQINCKNNPESDEKLKILQKWKYLDRIINGWDH